ncbi:DUF2255 family protein [Agromyces archimandritae]|uniref:DUF2255 family protein n=1 Tax=Agromyces archimandritae TaxID=2781962 RepID=A0A975FQT2_9MICO|nr:DUF2255 family protein [Agromyces archimandritae]QTX06013.1 DUF2255 family protein [Agromyces archimandritae]
MAWTADELERIGDAEELQVSSRRRDGSLRPFVTIWVVVVAGAVYIRSAYGPDNGWYRRAKAAGTGRIRAGGVERDVTFTPGDPAENEAVDGAYRDKYAAHPASIVATVVGEPAGSTTLRVSPES